MLNKVTYGADIEFFIRPLGDTEPIPAIGMVGGTKEKPMPLSKGYFIQEDNVAVEFNIPICKDRNSFVQAVDKGFRLCQDKLPPSFSYYEKASAAFKPVYLMHPQAREFGCEPDINAYTQKVNPRPHAENPYLRSAGGHIHIGWENPDMESRFELIRAMDVFVGLPSLSEDADTRRRELYGKAGAMRIKPYGVEYRTLSNYWLFDLSLLDLVSRRCEMAVKFINYGHKVMKDDYDDIVKAVNNGDKVGGHKIYKKYIKMFNDAAELFK